MFNENKSFHAGCDIKHPHLQSANIYFIYMSLCYVVFELQVNCKVTKT